MVISFVDGDLVSVKIACSTSIKTHKPILVTDIFWCFRSWPSDDEKQLKPTFSTTPVSSSFITTEYLQGLNRYYKFRQPHIDFVEQNTGSTHHKVNIFCCQIIIIRI